MVDMKINPTQNLAAATKMADGTVSQSKQNPSFLAGGVANLEGQPATDVFLNKSLNKEAEKINPAVKEKAGVGKKLATGLASLLVPGLGQAVNGQWGKAAGFFFGVGVADAVGFVLGGPIGMAAAHTVVNVWNIVDAYKNAN